MKYSIITITSNGLSHSIKCIESILKYTKDFQLIIVDNNSTDGTVGYLNEIEKNNSNLKILYQVENASFAENNNTGLKYVVGEYVIFLNNDTIVFENWLERLEAHFSKIELDNLGAVGPVSNRSNGRQMVGIQNSEAWYQEHVGKWSQTGTLYGWCIMVKKIILDEIGGFDERFNNSYEDNDLCLRIQLAGYKLAIAYDTYIYHLGQGTLRQHFTMDGYKKNGEENQKRYYDKWNTTICKQISKEGVKKVCKCKKKLVAVYRTNGGEHLEESLEQTSKFADSIIIHFCRAPKSFQYWTDADRYTDGYKELFSPKEITREEYVDILRMKSSLKIVKVEFYDGIFQEDYERNWLLQEALKLHEAGKADWCISIDDDEIYENKFIDRVQKMMNPCNPEVMGYWCNWRTIWERRLDKEYYRTDSTFGSFTNYRFFRLIKGQKITSKHPEGHHCGSAPILPPENLRWTGIRVKHLGYDTPEQRQKKFEFYEANDNFKSRADIGYADYRHLISKNVKLEEWNEENGISCVMMLKNEEEYIKGCLENVESIIDELIVVDTGSTDKTMEIVADFANNSHVKVLIVQYPWEDNYSTPRNYGLRLATKRWILHMDADERIKDNEIQGLFKMSEDQSIDVGIFHVVNYLEELKTGEKPKYASTESCRLFRNIPELYYTGVVHETIDDALFALQTKRNVNVVRAPLILHHYGFLKKKSQIESKLDYYEKLNYKQIEITDSTDGRPFFNLALHWLSNGEEKKAIEYFQKALKANPRLWYAKQQMAALNIKSTKAFLRGVLEIIPSTHAFKKEAEEILEFLEKKSFGCYQMKSNKDTKCQLQEQK